MKKFYLRTTEILQGDFEIKELNLLVVFQVNCPGCFLYSLPQANKIRRRYEAKGLNVLGLSTAFEDFEWNTLENTRSLLSEGKVVGETKKALMKLGKDKLPYNIEFPVAFDQLGKGSEIFQREDAYFLCETNPRFKSMSPQQQEQNVRQAQLFLMESKVSSYTFTINNLGGTPSWILFHKNMTILEDWFGHREESDFFILLDKYTA
ncbi:MAG: hypothetical protein H6755_07995 [Candidatus Omnitrophica bacterium]|nr:hypothetical protein [Candidatus Omnitrophota bacterium]MCB9748334.1 hypothetical protein [Candidatus Omnitrophota bacterium]